MNNEFDRKKTVCPNLLYPNIRCNCSEYDLVMHGPIEGQNWPCKVRCRKCGFEYVAVLDARIPL